MNESQKKKTGLRRQTVAVIALAATLAALIVAQVIVSGLVQRFTLKDTYRDETGVWQTVKYTVKRDPSTGLYALYNKQGKKMQAAPDDGFNNYEANGESFVVYDTEVGGNQYRINTSTGEYALYAAVDTEDDEARGGSAANTRLLMFPRIAESDMVSLQVENQTGKFRVEKKDGSAVLSVWNGEEWVPGAIGVDRQAYVNLAVNCGYTVTLQKLDLSAPSAPRRADGSVNYAAYGLDPAGENAPAVYTVAQSGGPSYTVLVGDLTVNGAGYYVKRADKNAVYIIDTGIAAALSPVESLVTPGAFYPLGETTYPMVQNFFLWKVGSYNEEAGQADSQAVTAFSYRDLSLREYTLYQVAPYVIPEQFELLAGYSVNDWEITELLSRFYRVEYLACKKFMPDHEDLAAYGLTENFQYLTFDFDIGASGSGSGPFVRNALFISQKRYDEALGKEVCYIYSPPPAETEDPSLFEWGYDMIVAADPYYFSFIEWEQSRWYSPYYFSTDVSFIRELHLTFGEKQYDFYLDNSKTDQKNGISSQNLEVTCPQYDSPDHKLDYEVHTVVPTDTGGQEALDYTGVQNFKRLMYKLFLAEIEGDVDPAQFKAGTGMTVAEFLAADTADDKCIAKIRYHLEDYAGEYNRYWPANNRRDIVLRFYGYEPSGRKCLLSVEVLERDADGNLILDENGEVYSDPTRANALFYANTAALGVLAGYTQDLLDQVLIPQ